MKQQTAAIIMAFLSLASIISIFLIPSVYDINRVLHLDSLPSSSTLIPRTSSNNDVIEFEGASDFLSTLRNAYRKKITNPLPHCSFNTTNEEEMKVTIFNRAIEVDWIGRDVPAVEPVWSRSQNSSSCNFVALALPPSKETLQAALQQPTYISSFHTGSQCKKPLVWGSDIPKTCMDINFGGTLGTLNEKKCIEETPGGYQMTLWNQQNSNKDIYQCLKHFLQTDNALRAANVAAHAEGMIVNLTKIYSLHERGYCPSCDDLDWNSLAFLKWSETALRSIGVITDTDNDIMVQMLQQLKEKNTTLTKCVDALLPPIAGKTNTTAEQKRIWKEIGAYLSESTMEQSPSSLLRNFSGSFHGVLPPSPNVIYSQNALVGSVVNVNSEAYYPACTAYWYAILKRDSNGKLPKKAFLETNDEASRNGTIFSDLKSTPHILRNKIIESCAKNETKCPFPTYDLVIDVHQVYSHGFFHFVIEVWPRIGPLLSGLLEYNVPSVAIYVGCDLTFHQQFYELVGLGNITLIGDTPLFAREIIAPTQGFGHSPLLNYWNLVAMRQKVIANLGPIEKTENRTVLVIIRDASRRSDKSVYSETFLKELREGLPDSYKVKPFQSSDKEMMSCVACQVRAFMSADVIIGSHGAGLSQTLFAPTDALVLERIFQHDSQIYAELAFLLGMKYFPIDHTERSAKAYVEMINFADEYRRDK